MSEPKPPENVRAVMRDGREIPLECRYLGWFDGAHRWEAVHSLPEPPQSVTIGMLPGRTAVSVAMYRDG